MIALPLLTPRLTLREVEPGDLAAIAAYALHPAVVAALGGEPDTPEELARYVAEAVARRGRADRRIWDLVLVAHADRRVVGDCDLLLAGADGTSIALSAGDAEIGYTLHPDAWGRGLAAEAVTALTEAVLATGMSRRVLAVCEVENHRSRRVAESSGFQRIGCRSLGDRRVFVYAAQAGVWRPTVRRDAAVEPRAGG